MRRFSDVKADVAISVGKSFVERNRLAVGKTLRELRFDDAFSKVGDIVEARSEDTSLAGRVSSSDNDDAARWNWRHSQGRLLSG